MADIFDQVSEPPAQKRDIFDDVSEPTVAKGPITTSQVPQPSFTRQLSDVVGAMVNASPIELIPGGKEFLDKPIRALSALSEIAPVRLGLKVAEKIPGAVGATATGLEQGIKDVTQFFESPRGLGTMIASALASPAAARVIAGAFATQMAASEPETAKQLIEAVKSGDPKAIARSVVQNAANLAGIVGAGKAAISEVPAPKLEQVAPKTAEALGAEPPILKEGGEKSASSQPETTTLYGDVLPQPEQGLREVPEQKGGEGIQPQAQGGIQAPPSGGEVMPVAKGLERPTPPEQTLGIAPGQFLSNLTMPSVEQIKTSAIGTLKTMAGESMPKTTMANQKAGQLGVRLASAQAAIPDVARYTVARVLQGTDIDPVKFGAAMTENQHRGTRQKFIQAGDLEAAGKVVTLVGEKGVFKTEEQLQSFVNQPQVQAAAQRFKAIYESEIDPLARSVGLDPANKPPVGDLFPGVFINLFVPKEGGLVKSRTTTTSYGAPTLLATGKKGSKFKLQRTSAGKGYGIDFRDMVENVYEGLLPQARKNEFDKALEDADLAHVSEEKPEGNWVAFPHEKTRMIGIDQQTGDYLWQQTKNEKLWVRPDLSYEYSNAINLYKSKFGKLGSTLGFKIVNKYQMAGLMDATYHLAALSRRLWDAPTGLSPGLDTALSLGYRSDVLLKSLKLGSVAMRSFTDRMNKLGEVAQLSQIGAMEAGTSSFARAPIRWIVHNISNNIRLTLSEIHDSLSEQGILPATETSKREFINAGLQYNKRLQGPVMVTLRETGLGPFVTAGRAGLARGIRRLTLTDWGQAEGVKNKAYMAASILSRVAGTALLVSTANYLLNGSFTGREGTKLGNVDLGDDENGKQLQLEMAHLLGNEVRGSRSVGLRGYIESRRQGLDNNQALGAMVKDQANALMHPGIGPVPQFVYSFLAGKPTGIGAPEFPKVPEGGIAQYESNFKHAFEQLNPITYRGVIAPATGQKTEQKLTEPFLGALGVRRTMKQEKVEQLPAIVHGAQMKEYIDNLATRARKLPKEQRMQLIDDETQDLEGPDRARVIKEMMKRGVLKRD